MESFLQAKEPIHSYYCKIKISIIKILESRPLEVIVGVLLALLATIALLSLHSKRKREKMVNYYYLLICKILKEQVYVY